MIPSAISLSSNSAKINSKTQSVAIVGCGVLGTSLCKQLLSSPRFESTSVTAITKSTSRHESIKENIGALSEKETFQLTTYEDIPEGSVFENVVFCAPPSGFEDYPGAVKDAITKLWAGSNSGGAFVFTSSGGIYGPGDGETVSESTILPEGSSVSPRTQKLVDAERNTLDNDGCVIRLAGLYTLERGAHSYWLERGDGTVKGDEGGIINLLHYDDAAGSCMAALVKGMDSSIANKICLVSDGHPTTRRGICESALKSKRYGGFTMPTFLGSEVKSEKGKIYDGTWTNEFLDWKPMYSSFDEFMANSQ